jgi:hypothetical protein
MASQHMKHSWLSPIVRACCKSKTSTQVPSTVFSQFWKKKKAKFTSYLKTGKESTGVGRILRFYAGAGIKQKPALTPFSKNHENERLGTSLFCPEVPRDKPNQVQTHPPLLFTRIWTQWGSSYLWWWTSDSTITSDILYLWLFCEPSRLIFGWECSPNHLW